MNTSGKKASPKIVPPAPHKKATYTLPPDVLSAIDENWRFHRTLNETLADSKSEYVADLVRRDNAQKTNKPRARAAKA